MLNLMKFAVAMVLLAGWGLAAMSLHVVRTNTAVKLIPKNELSFGDTYVDVRHWSSDDEKTHPALFARLKQLDQTNLLDGATPEETTADAPEEKPSAVASAELPTGKKSFADSWYRSNNSRH